MSDIKKMIEETVRDIVEQEDTAAVAAVAAQRKKEEEAVRRAAAEQQAEEAARQHAEPLMEALTLLKENVDLNFHDGWKDGCLTIKTNIPTCVSEEAQKIMNRSWYQYNRPQPLEVWVYPTGKAILRGDRVKSSMGDRAKVLLLGMHDKKEVTFDEMKGDLKNPADLKKMIELVAGKALKRLPRIAAPKKEATSPPPPQQQVEPFRF